jgi:haloalkane dehalogenase
MKSKLCAARAERNAAMFRGCIRVMQALAIGLMTGCAAVDYGAYTTHYVERYQEATSYVTRSVIRSDGPAIHVREFGVANKARGPSIVLMHGFPDSQRLYDAVAPLLAKTRHVVTFDFVGWGDSDKPVDHKHDIASLRKDLETVLAAIDAESVVVVVHDLSGHPGIDWSLDNESRVAALVLLNTYYHPMQVLKPPEAIARFSTPGLWRDLSVWGASRVDSIWQRGVEEQTNKFYSNPAARDTYGKVFVHQALNIRPAFFSHNAIVQSEVAARAKETPRLKQFTRPVSIVFGADDPYLNADVANEFRLLFPKSAVHLVPNAGHYVQLDQPDKVADLIDEASRR